MAVRTKHLRLLKELPGDKVEVEDSHGVRWIVGKYAYERFKQTGFLHVPKEVALAFGSALNGRSYGDMSEPEKFEVMSKIIEAATKEPIETLLPRLASI